MYHPYAVAACHSEPHFKVFLKIMSINGMSGNRVVHAVSRAILHRLKKGYSLSKNNAVPKRKDLEKVLAALTGDAVVAEGLADTHSPITEQELVAAGRSLENRTRSAGVRSANAYTQLRLGPQWHEITSSAQVIGRTQAYPSSASAQAQTSSTQADNSDLEDNDQDPLAHGPRMQRRRTLQATSSGSKVRDDSDTIDSDEASSEFSPDIHGSGISI